jgi:hypothetical protein
MDRRDSLSLLTAASAISLIGLSGLTRKPNRGVDLPEWGLYLEQPEGWSQMSAIEMVALQRQQTYVEGSDYATEQITQPTLVLAFTCYPEPTPEMNPSILVFADHLPTEFKFDPLPAIRAWEIDYAKNVRHRCLLGEPSIGTFDNVEAARSKATFMIEEVSGFAKQVVRRSAALVHHGLGLIVMMTCSLSGHEKAESEFSEFERSIRFYET